MKDLFTISQNMHNEALRIIDELDLFNLWQSKGAEVNIVGSLKMGLMMKHRDIDLHIYSKSISIKKTSAILNELSKNTNILNITIKDLIKTEECCIECHADYFDTNNHCWQIDMIHIEKGTKYDGYFENIAKRVLTVLTPDKKETILKLKYETPENMKIFGIEYYIAVISDDIKTFSEFLQWRKKQNFKNIIEWCP